MTNSFNGATLTPTDVAEWNRSEAALLVGGIGALVAANTYMAFRGRTVVCVLVRRFFHLDHPNVKVRRRGWLAFDVTLASATVAFRHHIRHPWRQR